MSLSSTPPWQAPKIPPSYLHVSRREGRGKAALPAVLPAAQQALLGAHPAPLPLHQALARPQLLQVLQVLLQLQVQLPAAPAQLLLLRLALPLALLQPALPGLLLPPLLVAPALPAPLVLLELALELGDVGQLLPPLLQAAVLVRVLEGAASEGGPRGRGRAVRRLEQQPVDLDVAVLDGQGSLWGGEGQRGKAAVLSALGWELPLHTKGRAGLCSPAIAVLLLGDPQSAALALR